MIRDGFPSDNLTPPTGVPYGLSSSNKSENGQQVDLQEEAFRVLGRDSIDVSQAQHRVKKFAVALDPQQVA